MGWILELGACSFGNRGGGVTYHRREDFADRACGGVSVSGIWCRASAMVVTWDAWLSLHDGVTSSVWDSFPVEEVCFRSRCAVGCAAGSTQSSALSG